MNMPVTGTRVASTILGALMDAVARLQTMWHPVVLRLVYTFGFFPQLHSLASS